MADRKSVMVEWTEDTWGALGGWEPYPDRPLGSEIRRIIGQARRLEGYHGRCFSVTTAEAADLFEWLDSASRHPDARAQLCSPASDRVREAVRLRMQ